MAPLRYLERRFQPMIKQLAVIFALLALVACVKAATTEPITQHVVVPR
jgi:hypothetical protein